MHTLQATLLAHVNTARTFRQPSTCQNAVEQDGQLVTRFQGVTSCNGCNTHVRFWVPACWDRTLWGDRWISKILYTWREPILKSAPESSPVPIQRPQNNDVVRSYSAARPEINRASRSIRAAAGGSDTGCTRISCMITQPTWPELEIDQYMLQKRSSFVCSCVK